MDRKRRGYTDKKSAVMISLPSPFSKEDSSSYFNMKNINTVFGVKHARVALIFVVILVISACVYLSFGHSNYDHFRIQRTKCPKLSFRPRDDVQVEPFRLDLKSQVLFEGETFLTFKEKYFAGSSIRFAACLF